MDQQAGGFFELRFKTHFLESKASAFQDMFVAVMSKAHPGDFMPCRPRGSLGDRKNDGYPVVLFSRQQYERALATQRDFDRLTAGVLPRGSRLEQEHCNNG
jgi:hypothetical protein